MLIESRSSLDPEVAALAVAQQRETGAVPGDDDECLVAVIDGRAVGYATLRQQPGCGPEIKRLYVRPAFRNRGIAAELLMAADLLAETP